MILKRNNMGKTGRENQREQRRAAREFMMKIVYQMDIAGRFVADEMDRYMAQGFATERTSILLKRQYPACSGNTAKKSILLSAATGRI